MKAIRLLSVLLLAGMLAACSNNNEYGYNEKATSLFPLGVVFTC